MGPGLVGLGLPKPAVRGFDISRHNFDAFVVGSYLVRTQGEVTTPSGLTTPQFAHCYSSAADIPFVVGFREHAQRQRQIAR